jgi:hypothetical protein
MTTSEVTRIEAHECSWCRLTFETVPKLLDHVVDQHLDEAAAAA